jgi:DNA transposition AAA+ family ATPase
MKNVFIKTQNYIKLSEAMSRLKSLPVTADRMGIAYGNFGLGKTVSLERITATEEALLLRSDQTWTVSSALRKLCFELGLDVSGRSSTLFERVIETLLLEPRIIIVDEIDTLLRTGKYEVFELFRDIHDNTKNIIFFVGMEDSLAKIKRHRHYFSRLTEIVKFEPIVKSDIKAFCELCEKTIKDDLIDYFSKRYQNLRQIRVFLVRLEEWAMLNDIESIGLSEFKKAEVEK